MQLRVSYKTVEPRDEPSPTGFVRLEHGRSSAVLLTPDEIDPSRLYPLFTVLHGAGRQDEALAKAYRDEPNRREALFLIPRSVEPTWDLIASEGRSDLDFFEYAYDLLYRRYPGLKAGDRIILGSMNVPPPAAPGCHFSNTLEGWETLRVEFVD